MNWLDIQVMAIRSAWEWGSEEQKRKLYREWPTLAHAIRELVGETAADIPEQNPPVRDRVLRKLQRMGRKR